MGGGEEGVGAGGRGDVRMAKRGLKIYTLKECVREMVGVGVGRERGG